MCVMIKYLLVVIKHSIPKFLLYRHYYGFTTRLQISL